jgi:zinc transport system substrate-binding protein
MTLATMTRATTALAMLALATLTACSQSSRPNSERTTWAADSPGGNPARIIATFYPLEWLATQIGSDLVTVTNLTPPGVEPHDLELSPRDVARLSEADLIVTVHGFQPSVDTALSELGDALSQSQILDLSGEATRHGDPHFWLDPQRLAGAAKNLGATVAAAAPRHREQIEARTAALVERLHSLDQEFDSGLTACAERAFVTTHTAFGYLADRYHLTQRSIVGVDPEAEPSPKSLATIAEFISAEHINTVYYEPRAPRELVDTIASETGATPRALDPLEGLTPTSKGRDYVEVMQSNLAALRAGLRCS